MVTEETKEILGRKIRSNSKTIQSWKYRKNVLGIRNRSHDRYADMIEDELPEFEKEVAAYKEQDEDVLSYALFPQVATEYFEVP